MLTALKLSQPLALPPVIQTGAAAVCVCMYKCTCMCALVCVYILSSINVHWVTLQTVSMLAV